MKHLIRLGVLIWIFVFYVNSALAQEIFPGGKVVLENDKVRVTEYSAKPHEAVCGVGMHSHPAHLTVILQAAKVKVTLPEGKTVERERKGDAVFWSEAGTHSVENIDTLIRRSLFIELKEPAAPTSFASAFRNDCLGVWADFTKKMVALAEAMPEEKYDWRPEEGVRSVGEVFTHVASGNYFFLQMAGVQPPAGVDMKMVDTVKGKAKIIDALKQSCEFTRQSLANTSDADFDTPAKIFGQDRTVREAYFLLVTHSPEHLGQSIAYARMNGVVPPWTAERQARQQEKK